MSDFKHTSGHWLAAAKPSSVVGWPIVSSPQGRVIADVMLGHRPPDCSDETWAAHYGEVAANARLLAAAPDLLVALTELVAIIDAAGLNNLTRGVQLGQVSWLVKATDRMSAAQAAIAKTTVMTS